MYNLVFATILAIFGALSIFNMGKGALIPINRNLTGS